MTDQNLSDYIKSVASKQLTPVETDQRKSNQHELNGVSALKAIFGDDHKNKLRYPTMFAYLSDDESRCLTQDGSMTWYESRKPPRSEFRLYYDKDDVFSVASPGDILYIIQKPDNSLLTLVCEKDSVIESQVKWLFDLKAPDKDYVVRKFTEGGSPSFAAKTVLDLIGIETVSKTDKDIEELLAKYSDFPSSAEFSDYARSFVDVDPVNRPDEALVAWLNKEDTFFRCN